MSQSITPEQFGQAFQAFIEQFVPPATPRESVFRKRLHAHFETDPSQLPVLSQQFRTSDHPSLQTAIDTYLKGEGRTHKLVGVSSDLHWEVPTFSDLLRAPESAEGGITDGPVQYDSVVLEADRVLTCIQTGLLLVQDGSERLAIFVRGSRRPYERRIDVDVMATEQSVAERFLATLRTLMREHNVYRGKVVSLDQDEMRQLVIRVQPLPTVTREKIILPAGLLDRIERQAVRFSEHADELRAAGRHLRRGMLLYGPPGTGKTLTAMYLASRMPGRTVLLITGRGQGLLEEACSLARLLQPATVILEDVDLIAEERSQQTKGCNALLFELLNQMDGLSEDADILFLLTTNRPDALEPALAARPGRIDLALEVPPPDADDRRKLFALYAKGLKLEINSIEPYVQRTLGSSGAFIRELLRKAALSALDEGHGSTVTERHLDDALQELVFEGGALTRSLLGASVAKGD